MEVDLAIRVEKAALKSQSICSCMQALDVALFRDEESTPETYELGYYLLTENVRELSDELRAITKEMFERGKMSA